MSGSLAAVPAEPTIRGLQSHNASDASRTLSEQVSAGAARQLPCSKSTAPCNHHPSCAGSILPIST